MSAPLDLLLSFLGAATDVAAEPEFNASALVTLTRLSPSVLALAALILVVGLGLSARALIGARRSVQIGLLTLRVLAALALFVLLLEPGLKRMAKSRIPNRVVVALDVSESMSRDDATSQSRVRRALTAVDALTKAQVENDAPFRVELVGFDENATGLGATALQNLQTGAVTPTGSGTRLAAAIDALDEGSSPENPLGGVVILSDGADTTGLSASLTPELRSRLEHLEVPVHTVLVGSEREFKDVALDRVLHDEFAFVRNKIRLSLVVRHTGFQNLEVPITLKEDGKTVLIKESKLDGPGETIIDVTFEPKSAGKHIYTLIAPIHPDEAITENNRVDFTLRVIRDRIRVLQVAGQPSWDERFVRRLLKENPSVDLISFFILRSPTDNAGAASEELSLIPFPTRELFTEELHTFDVVILQNFNYRPYQMGLYLKNLKDFVERDGGGLMMIGGSLSFSEGEYENTPVADVLPVELLPGAGHLSEERFRPLLTESGRTHPITHLGNLAPGDNPFARLPELEGLNLVRKLAPGAVSLLSHPYLNADGQSHPVLAVREVGQGRSMAILTDSTWLWSLPHVGAGGRGDVHRRLFANALRWLIRDPELSRVKVSTDRPAYEPGEEVVAEVRSYDERYGPLGGADVEVRFEPLDAPAGTVPEAEPIKTKTLEDGLARIRFTPPSTGAWRVRVDARHDSGSIGSDLDAFVVRGARAEALFAEPRPDLMKSLAAAGAGRFVSPEDISSLEFIDHGVERVHRQRTDPLWNRWVSLMLVVGMLTVEWWWRRRRGFA